MTGSAPPTDNTQTGRARHRRVLLITWSIVVLGLIIGVIRMATYDPNYVVKVDDANKLILKSGGVRVVGVEVLPFETGGLGAEAAEFTKKLVLDRRIRVETDPEKVKDDADWTLGYVFVEVDGKELFLNEELLRHGYGEYRPAYPHLSYRKRLDAAQAEAQRKKLGRWHPDFKPPTPGEP
ncbi:MAG TPA: thermonuclease family protein [Planctomycetota bacterium]|nr:thermonuclease family protein [Planctomycetota bacterium]